MRPRLVLLLLLLLALAHAPACPPAPAFAAPAPGEEPRERTRFVFAPGGTVETVHLAGAFNGWSATATAMARDGDGGSFSFEIELPHGLHPYKFVVDGRDWRFDPAAERFTPDGVGGTNSVRLVGPDFEALARAARRGDGVICAAALRYDPAHARHLAPSADGRLRVQLRALENDLVAVRFAAPALPHGRIALEPLPPDPPFQWFRARLPEGIREGTFEIEDGEASLELPAPPPPAAMPRRFSPPPRLAGRTLYHILIDRFDNGDPGNDPPWVKPWGTPPDLDAHLGGDLAGIRRRIPRLLDLGAETLMLSPLFESRAAHAYEPEDFDRICARFGGERDFAELARALDDAGVALVVDLVLNHTGTGHAAFRDLIERGAASPHRDWYFPHSFPVDPAKANYRGWRGHGNLPELNTDHPAVRDMLLSVGEAWARRAAAFRLDAADDIETRFWRPFRERALARNPSLLLIGELWGDASPWLAGDPFDSATHYPFRRAVIDRLNGDLADAEFRRRLVEPLLDYPDPTHHLLLLPTGSHDTKRLATELAGGTAAVALYATLLFAWPGVPHIYYGDELGMAGGDDPDNRRAMDWTADPESSPLYRRFRALAALRRARASLARGALIDLTVERGLVSFERRDGAERTRFAGNFGDAPAELRLPPGVAPPRDLVSGLDPARTAQGALVFAPGESALFDVSAHPALDLPELTPALAD